ncbi:MAG TPA: hypothetical protein VH561_07465 [Micromonosporaceae bacterium]
MVVAILEPLIPKANDGGMAAFAPASVRDDRVLPLTRIVAYTIVPFLVVAFAVLYPVPTDTGRLFAWHIVPTLTPMILGSAYLGGAYFFLRAGRAQSWSVIKGGFVPVAVFASLMGIATIVHWDKFNHHHVAFWLWAFLYFTTPFLVFWTWSTNRRFGELPADDGRELPPLAARMTAAVGGLALAVGLFLFAIPSAAIRIWPWQLTPLTSRVLGAVFCLGLAGVGTLFDRRWTSARLPFEVALIMLTLILVAGLRAHAELDAGNPLTWLFAAGFAGLIIAVGGLYGRMERRSAVGAP